MLIDQRLGRASWAGRIGARPHWPGIDRVDVGRGALISPVKTEWSELVCPAVAFPAPERGGA